MADPTDSTCGLSPPPDSRSRSAMRRPPAVRSISPSPVRHRISDDLLSRLTPACAFEALRNPTAALKNCLNNASASEQTFVTRTAVASRKIFEWHDELSEWPWPTESSSAGFEMPPPKRRKVLETSETTTSEQSQPESETEYIGCLRADQVAQYEKRIDKIQEGLDKLNLEEIKTYVLHNHILPLSRPGTPFSDGGVSLLSFSKLEDLGAVITAITVQALPILSKLSRLLNTWNVRLVVIRKVPGMLLAITDAEIALESGFNAIEVSRRASLEHPTVGNEPSVSVLSRGDFEVMKSVLQQKVAKPGRDLDFMLDALEGTADTLPNDWLERMEVVERDYVEWVATAEKSVREGEWVHNSESTTVQSIALEPVSSHPIIQIQQPSPTRLQHEFSKSFGSQGASLTPHSRSPAAAEEQDPELPSNELKILIDAPDEEVQGSVSRVLDLTTYEAHQRDVCSGALLEDTSLDFDGSIDRDLSDNDEGGCSLLWSEADQSTTPIRTNGGLRPSPVITQMGFPDLESEYSFLEAVDEEGEEPELPPVRFESRASSSGSIASTTVNNPVSTLDHVDYREDSPDAEFPRLPDSDEPLASDALSPPSSPPLRYKPRSTSVTFKDLPEIMPSTEIDVTPPRSPLDPPEVFDPESSFDGGSQLSSPTRSVVSMDDQLHLQISEVLKGLPTNIRLSSRTRAINLNPPDFQHPSRPKPRTSEPFRRSTSAMSTMSTMSSRAGTPSFLLAPAKSSRPRSRNSQEARTYLLSRSASEQPMKLLIRCVGENGERVMVRVGGGWADLGEYLKEYAIHHGRRSKGEGKVEVRDLPTNRDGSSPSSRPTSAMDSPMTPLVVRKTRKSLSEEAFPGIPKLLPATPQSFHGNNSDTPPSDGSAQSRGSMRHSSWIEDDSSVLGLSGPKPKSLRVLSEESRAWVEDVKTKVRSASSEQRVAHLEGLKADDNKLFEMDKVGGTKRLFRKNLK